MNRKLGEEDCTYCILIWNVAVAPTMKTAAVQSGAKIDLMAQVRRIDRYAYWDRRERGLPSAACLGWGISERLEEHRLVSSDSTQSTSYTATE